MANGDAPGYPLEKFIYGIVQKLIRSYRMSDFLIESTSGRIDSDFRADLIQSAWVAALQCQKTHPKESENPAYIRRAVINALLKVEQADRQRRDFTDALPEPDQHELQVQPDINFAAHDVAAILANSKLTPTERLITELFYGLTERGELSLRQVSRLLDKSEAWTQARLTAAKIKMQVSVGR